jgi:hypothetical protein
MIVVSSDNVFTSIPVETFPGKRNVSNPDSGMSESGVSFYIVTGEEYLRGKWGQRVIRHSIF